MGDEELVQVQSEIRMPSLQDDLGPSLTRTVQQRNLHHFLNDQAKEDAKAAVHPKASKKKAQTKAHAENDTSMLSGAMYRAVAARNLRNQLAEDNKSFSEMNEQVVAESKKEPKPKVVKKKKHWYDN